MAVLLFVFRLPERFSVIDCSVVGWVTLRSNPPFAPIGAILPISGCLKLFALSTPAALLVGWEAHPTAVVVSVVGWASLPTIAPLGAKSMFALSVMIFVLSTPVGVVVGWKAHPTALSLLLFGAFSVVLRKT